ncbi:MAG TPA: twin-arginine translocase TatA/TatE family subunit [Steroidobacteraceae bacterium]|nr:twin-arginine translocase TatA/TatE family subunit [Steroidobacteraceae bacterium]
MFFDFPEIVIIFGLALVVLGPKKLPATAAQIGRWVGRARAMARQFREQLEQEVNSVESALDTHPPREPTIGNTPAPVTTFPSSPVAPPAPAAPSVAAAPAAPEPHDFEANLAATGPSWSPESTFDPPSARPHELKQAEALGRVAPGTVPVGAGAAADAHGERVPADPAPAASNDGRS